MFVARLFPAVGFVVSAFLISGCANEERVYHVSGTVTFGDKPVPAGLVFFDPDPAKGTSGPQGFANIKGGQYSTAEAGQGIRGGTYTIRVLGYDGKQANEAPFGQPLFNEYQLTKELPKENTALNLDVPRKK